jgi:hypothetical protein
MPTSSRAYRWTIVALALAPLVFGAAAVGLVIALLFTKDAVLGRQLARVLPILLALCLVSMAVWRWVSAAGRRRPWLHRAVAALLLLWGAYLLAIAFGLA